MGFQRGGHGIQGWPIGAMGPLGPLAFWAHWPFGPRAHGSPRGKKTREPPLWITAWDVLVALSAPLKNWVQGAHTPAGIHAYVESRPTGPQAKHDYTSSHTWQLRLHIPGNSAFAPSVSTADTRHSTPLWPNTPPRTRTRVDTHTASLKTHHASHSEFPSQHLHICSARGRRGRGTRAASSSDVRRAGLGTGRALLAAQEEA